MITENGNIKIITPKEGYLLTNGETITDIIFIGKSSSIEDWREIPIEVSELIKTNDKSEEVFNSTLVFRVNKLEEYINSFKNPYVSSSSIPEGDYMNPILLMEGGLVTEKNKWYYINDKDRPHRAIVVGFVKPNDFYDKTWFDFV